MQGAVTQNYGMIGTAFDYLLRFFVEANNDSSKVISTPWVAEYSIPMLRGSEHDERARSCIHNYSNSIRFFQRYNPTKRPKKNSMGRTSY